MDIIMPVAFYMERKTKKDKRCPISMNYYRNAHFLESNKVKQMYKEEVASQIGLGRELITPIQLNIYYVNGQKRLSDIDGMCSIHAKFFLDALVELGYLPDDNFLYVSSVKFLYAGYDKGNPRVVIRIDENTPQSYPVDLFV